MDQEEKSDYENLMQDHNPGQGGGVVQFLGELIKVALIAAAIILPVRYFLIKPFYVNGASMEPTHHDHEYLIIDEITYRFNDPERGDVVVFRYPEDLRQFFIKRIIGLPGERVVVADGDVFVYNRAKPAGEKLAEPYLSPGLTTSGASDITLASGEFYVLGDNRPASLDSRRFGPIKSENIVGRTWLRGWPFSRIGVLSQYEFDI